MCEELQEDFCSSGCSVTKRTVSNEMLRNGLKSRRPKKTPPLLKRHRNARLKFVRQHKEKENSFWERVLWIDEIKIELFGYNYWNHMEERWRSLFTEEHGTNCQIWQWQYNDLGMFFSERWGQNISNRW